MSSDLIQRGAIIIGMDHSHWVVLLWLIVFLTPNNISLTSMNWPDSQERVEKLLQYIKLFVILSSTGVLHLLDQTLQDDESTCWSTLLAGHYHCLLMRSSLFTSGGLLMLILESFNTKVGLAFFESGNLADLSETIYTHSINKVTHLVHRQSAEYNASRFLFGLQIWGCGDEILRASTKMPPHFNSPVENVWFGFVAFREKTELSLLPLYIKIGIAFLLFLETDSPLLFQALESCWCGQEAVVFLSLWALFCSGLDENTKYIIVDKFLSNVWGFFCFTSVDWHRNGIHENQTFC